jgi:hypothetical protein
MRILMVLGVAATLGLGACAIDPYYGSGYGYGGGYGPPPPPNYGYGSPDAGLDATYGDIRLDAGFDEDPYVVRLTAGGTVQASSAAGDCVGIVAVAPDVQVDYRAGDYNLTFRATAYGDTTLLINGPDGQWYCDDDSGGDQNPMLTFYEPQSGIYDVWVGVYEGETQSAELFITELE